MNQTRRKNTDTRAEKIERIARLVWSSLESHLGWTYGHHVAVKKCAGCKKEGVRFHQQCVREYAQILKDLSDLY